MDKSFAYITPGSAGFRSHGIGLHTVSTATTSVTPDANIGYFANIACTTTTTVAVGQGASVSGTGAIGVFRRGSSGDAYGGFFAHSRCQFSDTTYDSTSATTGSRLNGLLLYSGGAPNTTSRGGVVSLCGFQRENSGASSIYDTTWKFITCDGVNTAVADTTMAFTAGGSGTGKVYDFWIWCPLGSSTIYWQVDNVTDGTSQSGSTSSNLPATNTALLCTSGIGNLDTSPNSTSNIKIARLYVESDRG